MIRTYEFCGNDDYIFTNATKLIDNGQKLIVSFIDRETGKIGSKNIFCSYDETKILLFGVVDDGARLIVSVQCAIATPHNFVSQHTFKSHNFCDFYKSSANSNKKKEVEEYDSISSFEGYCKYGMDYIDDKVRYHPCWGCCESGETGHNCYEGDDDFRLKLKEINRLGIFTYISQPSLVSTNIENMFIQYPFVTGFMNKQNAQILLKAIDNLNSNNLIYVCENKTNYDSHKHSNLLVNIDTIKVSYDSRDKIDVNGTWFSLSRNCNKAFTNRLIPNIDPNDYCLVSFMDNRNNDELFDVIINLLNNYKNLNI